MGKAYYNKNGTLAKTIDWLDGKRKVKLYDSNGSCIKLLIGIGMETYIPKVTY